jgi:hypothetical protein
MVNAAAGESRSFKERSLDNSLFLIDLIGQVPLEARGNI